MFVRIAVVLMVSLSALSFAEDKPVVALDPVKYPQDTPEKALDTLAKSLEAERSGILEPVYRHTPEHTKRMLERSTRPLKPRGRRTRTSTTRRKIEGRKMLAKFVRQLQADKVPGIADKLGTAVRFFEKDGQFVQLNCRPTNAGVSTATCARIRRRQDLRPRRRQSKILD